MYFYNVQIIQCKHPAPGQGLQLPTVTLYVCGHNRSGILDNDQIIWAELPISQESGVWERRAEATLGDHGIGFRKEKRN